jgi:hypothetical protein
MSQRRATAGFLDQALAEKTSNQLLIASGYAGSDPELAATSAGSHLGAVGL